MDAGRAALLAREAQAGLEQARNQPAGVEGARRALSRAGDQLDRALSLLSRPAPRALAAVPGLGRTLDVETAVVDAAASTVRAARGAADATAALDAAAGLDPAALRSLAAQLERDSAVARDDVRALGALSLTGTPTAVARAAAQAREALGPAVEDLRTAAVGADLAARLLGADGPRRVLVSLMNNAELHGAGGYASSFATATADRGRVRLTPFSEVVDVGDPPERARRVPAPAELVEDYGPFLADTTLWRTWTMSPDVPDVALVGSRVAGELLGTAPDVVLLLDVPALAALADAVGGVPLDGRVLAGEELERALLVDAYAEAGADQQEQVARRARLQAAASAALSDLLSAGAPPVSLVPVLQELAAGRHVSLWSAKPAEQRVLQRLGLTGELGVGCSDLVSVNVNNLNANKLDYWVRREVDVDVRLGPRTARVVQTVRLRNDAPADLVPYVAGALTPGVPVERVELSAGPGAVVRSLTLDGAPARGTVRAGADRTRVASTVRLRPGDDVELVLTYDLPRDGAAYRLEVVPQPLASDAEVRVVLRAPDGQVLVGDSGREGPLARSERLVAVPRDPAPPPGDGLLDRLRRWWSGPVRL